MSYPWFRMYAEFAGNPVVQSLAFEDQRHFVVLLCLKCDGTLDRNIAGSARDRIICRGLGLDPVAAYEAQRRLIEVGLIDKKWQPTGWNERQYVSDNSTPRVRKCRKNKKTGNVTTPLLKRDCNAPDTDTDSDSEKNPPNPPSRKEAWVPPAWINLEAWSEFEQHRRDMRKPMTDQARTKAANQLQGLTHEQQQACIDKSIQSRWAGLFPEKANAANQQSRRQKTVAERGEELGAEIWGRINGTIVD